MDLELAAMQIVGNAGESRSLCFEALSLAKKGEFEEAEKKLREAREVFLKAHEVQTELITEEVEGNVPKIGLLTDNKYTPQNIAKILLEQNLTNFEIIVGENLSYDNEIIRKYKVEQLAFEEKKFDINVVVIREGKTCTI